MVPFEEIEKIVRGERSWRLGRLAKNVGHKKMQEKHEAGVQKPMIRASSTFSQKMLFLEL